MSYFSPCAVMNRLVVFSGISADKLEFLQIS